MKYRVGDRFRYFSIVGSITRVDNKYDLFEALCDCGKFFEFPTNKIYDRKYKSCSNTQLCIIYKESHKKSKEWPNNNKKRMDCRHVFKVKKEEFKRVVLKSCKTCNKHDLSLFFHSDMQQTCLGCLGDMTPNEFKNGEGKRRRDKKADKIEEVIGSAKDKDGYIYIMYSAALNLYKVGVSVSPFIRLNTLKNVEYQIKDLELLCIGNPIGRSFNCESYIHKIISKYKQPFNKPCGGVANELFSCDLSTVTNVFLSVCQEAYWLDDKTRDLITIDIPKIDKELIEIVANDKTYYREKRKTPDRIYAKRMMMERHNAMSFRGVNLKGVECYYSGHREDGKFMSVSNVGDKRTELGVFNTWEEAYHTKCEFIEFIQYERLKRYSCRIIGAKETRGRKKLLPLWAL